MTIKLFATLKQKAGASAIDVTVEDGITVTQLRAAVGQAYPALAELAARSVVAVNQEFAFDQDIVRAGDEIALFPPVSGG
jgi:molybdopterin converting factor subunit 1